MDRVLLASDDFVLRCSGGETYLTARYPTENRQITKSGEPEDWSQKRWEELLREARRFGCGGLIEALEDLRNSVVKERIQNEPPVFDDSSGEEPEAVHTLRVHYSREENYVRVTGTNTQEHRRELAELGLRWSPRNREWCAEFDEGLLEAVKEYVAENDTPHDPSEIGYVRCEDCGGFRPEEKACSCNF